MPGPDFDATRLHKPTPDRNPAWCGANVIRVVGLKDAVQVFVAENAMRLILVTMVLAVMAPGVAFAIQQDAVRQRAEQACYNDVMKYCNEVVPDEAKIAQCMGVNRKKLDPECRTIYDRGL